MPLLRFGFLFLIALLSCDGSSLDNARRARALLGPDVWSRIIRVENSAVASVYPGTVHALVFELSGLLWFYTDANGTQSFSLHRNKLAAEKADFAPLLKDIEPGFGRYEVLSESDLPAVPDSSGPLLNGCMIESVAAARTLVDQGNFLRRASLVSFYFKASGSVLGHTVLAYEDARGAFLVDPNNPKSQLRVGTHLPEEPMDLARRFGKSGVEILNARALAIAPPRPSALARNDVRSTEAEPHLMN